MPTTDYFTFYGINAAFGIDLSDLRARFIEKSKTYHPDFHSDKSKEEQDEILELSTYNNQAWKTLSDPVQRTAYVLRLNDKMPEEGQARVPQDFLMEIMDINEALMALEMAPDEAKRENILTEIAHLDQDLDKKMKKAQDAWDQSQDADTLDQVCAIYLKQKYLLRMKERL